MRNRLAATLVAIATAAAVATPSTTALAATGGVTTEHVAASTLGRGAAPKVDYLVGRALHSSTGSTVRLPRSWRLHSTQPYLPDLLTLVGRVGTAWYVQRMDNDYYDGWLYRVTATSVRRISAGSDYGSGFLTWYLTADHRRIVRHSTDGYGGCDLRVTDLTGALVAHHGCGNDGNYVGATSASVWYTDFSSSSTHRWAVPGSTTTSLGVRGYLADPTHDLLFLRPTSTTPAGVTSLSAPRAPTWTAAFRAVSVSSGGTYVAGYGAGAVQVRRVSDGTLVRQLAFGSTNGLQWESDAKLLVAVDNTKKWIVRCPVTGDCHTAAGPSSASYELAQVPSWHAEATGG
ncbi:hypothetical protein GCM10028801_00420 [Nocardioides maradonensis]